MKTQEFEQILSEVKNMDGVTPESVVEVATRILQEDGKDKRTVLMREAEDRRAELYRQQRLSNNNFKRNYSKNIKNGNLPATEPQKYTLNKHNVDFSENITKAEASKLLDSVLGKSGSDGKGRASPAFSF